ncbi:unnamed protein product [Somion occarium]|uniref:F-box domain-containing protein n=1 Tax=Somion occarium TaxID=3059160 RepID=A0ABP1CSM5_9APHY
MDISVESSNSSFPPSHISQLPPELLTKIFLHLADAFRHGRLQYNWLTVIRVCRFWHDAALGCPSLWAFVDTSYPVERIKMLLERSGQVPLIVKPRFAYRPRDERLIDEGILALVLQEVPRIMKLEIMITESLATKLAMAQYSSLRSLCLKNAAVDAEMDTDHEKTHSPLNLDVPQLRSLKVYGFKFWEAKTLFRPSLRKLVLNGTGYPPLREVSECIRALPLLSSLDLVRFDTLDDGGTIYPRDYKPVNLHHLQRLHVNGSQCYSQFLHNLEIAPGASVSLRTSTCGMADEAEHIDSMIYDAKRFCGLPNNSVVRPSSQRNSGYRRLGCCLSL